MDIAEAVERLAVARKTMALIDGHIADAERAVGETPEGLRLKRAKEARALAQQESESADADVRSIAVAMYQLDGQRKPHAGVEVKLYQTLEYDKAAATEWCREHLPTAMQFDVKRFERVAVDVGAPVKVIETPRVFISKEL